MTEQYRGAIELNNAGVNLLKQGAYKQGLDILRDAVYLLNATVQPTTTTKKHPHLFSDVQKKLQRAKRCLAEPTIDAPASSPEVMKIKLVTLQKHPEDSVLSPFLSSIVSSAAMTFCVLIDPEDGLASFSSDCDLESATILYNLGIAYVGMYKVAMASSRGDQMTKTMLTQTDKHRHNAARFFHLSYALLSIADNRSREECDYFELTRILLFNFAVIQNMVRFLHQIGSLQQAEEYSNELTHIKRTLQQLEKIPEPLRRRELSIAPAA